MEPTTEPNQTELLDDVMTATKAENSTLKWEKFHFDPEDVRQRSVWSEIKKLS